MVSWVAIVCDVKRKIFVGLNFTMLLHYILSFLCNEIYRRVCKKYLRVCVLKRSNDMHIQTMPESVECQNVLNAWLISSNVELELSWIHWNLWNVSFN
jgi:hypothetical protein